MYFHNDLFKIDNLTFVGLTINYCLYLTWVPHAEKSSRAKVKKSPELHVQNCVGTLHNVLFGTRPQIFERQPVLVL